MNEVHVIIVRGGVVYAVDAFSSLEVAEQFYPDDTRIPLEPGMQVQPGWTYDGSAFTAPEVPQPAYVPAMLSPLEFLRRVPMTTRIAIREAAKTDPVIQDAMELLMVAKEIDVHDADTVAFVTYMRDIKGLLTNEQAEALLY